MSKWLRNPIVIIGAMGMGVILGLVFPNISSKFTGLGEVYLLLLRMTIIPILIGAIVSSIGNFIQNPVLQKITWFTIITLTVSMIVVVTISLTFGAIFKPGIISPEKTSMLSNYIGAQSGILEVTIADDGLITTHKNFFVNFIKLAIPENIFLALSDNNTLSIVFFSIIIGLAAGLMSKKSNQTNVLLIFFENLFETFQFIIGWVLTLLPFGLLFIISSQVATLGFTIISATIKFVILFHILGVMIIILTSTIIGIAKKESIWKVIKSSLYPTSIAFFTRNSIACITPAISTLKNDFNISPTVSKLLIPLSMLLARYGNAIYFALVTAFAVQLYGFTPSPTEYIMLLMSILFAGLATAGSSGFATLGVISIALLPIGIPVEPILLILYAIDPIIDPLRTSLIVNTNYSLVLFIGKHKYANVKEEHLTQKTPL